MLPIRSLFWPIAQDATELTVIITACYYWLAWLAADKQKRLPLYFYGYCAVWALSFLFHLPTILALLEVSLPWTLILFITIHQKTIQRNLIGLYKVRPVQQADTQWLEAVLRCCLQTSHDLHILLEHTDALDDLLHVELPLEAPVTYNLMHYLIKCEAFKPEQSILINDEGQVKGINVQWIKHLALAQIETDILEKNSYHLNDNDGIFLRYSAKKRRFDLILKQQIYHELNVTQTQQSIHNYLTHTAPIKEEKIHHATDTTKEQAPHT